MTVARKSSAIRESDKKGSSGGNGGSRARWLSVARAMQGRPGVRLDELARDFGVSGRSVNRDIEVLRSVGIPIRYDAKVHGYELVDEQAARLFGAALTESQARLLILYLERGFNPRPHSLSAEELERGKRAVVRLLRQHFQGKAKAGERTE